jgi:DeoR/GlpR family transcriptional regulator of sugar metabolism
VESPLPAERHRRIEEILRERGAVRVSALAEALGVSEVTVRRDLEELEGRGSLERTHGGAVLARRIGREPAYVEAAGRNAEEKRRIGRAAAALVRNGDTIFLNGGTTTLEVFRHLDVSDVRVVTNHVGIAQESDEGRPEILLTGGEYRAPSNSCAGTFTTRALRGVVADRAFIGVEGVSRRFGLTTPAAAEAEIARVMIEQTHGDVVVVADHTKVGTVADFAIAPIASVRVLVTGEGIDEDYRQELEGTGVEVLLAGRPVATTGRGRG